MINNPYTTLIQPDFLDHEVAGLRLPNNVDAEGAGRRVWRMPFINDPGGEAPLTEVQGYVSFTNLVATA